MIRKARLQDVEAIHALINKFAGKGFLLPRSFLGIYESLRDFWVCEINKRIVACCALHITWKDLCEIRSLAVSSRVQNKGIGGDLIKIAFCEAKEMGCKSIFVLTFIPGYFKRFGFRRVSKDKLPHKIWAECISCSKFPDCKEIALVKKL